MLYRCSHYKECEVEEDCEHWSLHEWSHEDECLTQEEEMYCAEVDTEVYCKEEFKDFITEEEMKL